MVDDGSTRAPEDPQSGATSQADGAASTQAGNRTAAGGSETRVAGAPAPTAKADVLYCTGCGALYSVARFDQTRVYNCPKCQGKLALKADATVRMAQTGGATHIAGGSGGVAGDPLIGTQFAEYHIVKKIGEGGMGRIYLATQRTLNRQVAVKVLAQNLAANPEFKPRFEIEARAAARISHPNIVQVITFGENQGFPYFVMEFVDGQTTKERVQKGGPVEGDELASIMRQALVGLARAHELNIIHRDIKPDNLMVTTEGTVKIADFGLAKLTDEDMGITKTGTVFGTPYYMSPEQASGKDVDARSDVYSLGATFYYLMTGRVPFEGDSFVAIMRQVVNDPLKPPMVVNPKCSPRLGNFVTRMMNKKPEARFNNAGEALKALEQILQREGKAAEADLARPAVVVRESNAGYLGVGIALAAVLWALGAFILVEAHPRTRAFRDFMEIQEQYLADREDPAAAWAALESYRAASGHASMEPAAEKLAGLIRADCLVRLVKTREGAMRLLDRDEAARAFELFTRPDTVAYFSGSPLDDTFTEEAGYLKQLASISDSEGDGGWVAPPEEEPAPDALEPEPDADTTEP